jgi:5'-3' exonuclease
MKTWIALNMTPGIGPRKATQLLERFGSAENVFQATRTELQSLRLRPESIESIQNKEFHEKAEEEFTLVECMSLDWIAKPTLRQEALRELLVSAYAALVERAQVLDARGTQASPVARPSRKKQPA